MDDNGGRRDRPSSSMTVAILNGWVFFEPCFGQIKINKSARHLKIKILTEVKYFCSQKIKDKISHFNH